MLQFIMEQLETGKDKQQGKNNFLHYLCSQRRIQSLNQNSTAGFSFLSLEETPAGSDNSYN